MRDKLAKDNCMRFEKIENYWNQTETFEALQFYIDMNFDGLKDDGWIQKKLEKDRK